MTMAVTLATIVVGAGPAGLLFAASARILGDRAGVPADRWPIVAVDKRAAYERTHRLRMAEAPYRELAAAVADPRFDALLTFLEHERFRPEVNRLEAQLSALVGAVGVPRGVLTVGAGPGEVPLQELPAWLERQHGVPRDVPLTVVGADSVHSAVREAVRRGRPGVERTHQHLVRLRLRGDGLPDDLGVVERLKLSKVLASILDYRRNANGFAEVDLFLTAGEHRRLVDLGATPRTPVPLDAVRLATLQAPFFRRIAERLGAGFGAGPVEVSVQSTFRLEHRHADRFTHDVPGVGRVFLLGDAAISLPFFRGMACLARCTRALAEAHVDLALGAEPDSADVRVLLGSDPPRRVGLRPMPGRIDRARPVTLRGRRGTVVLHRWLWQSGVHVLVRGQDGAWASLYDRGPVGPWAAHADYVTLADPGLRYEREVQQILADELRVVEARAWLVRGAREFVRISAALPFPLQTWFLSLPDDDPRADRPTFGLCVNVGLALVAAAVALAGITIDRPGVWALSLPLQAAGGVAYAAALAFEGGPQRFVRAVWRWQIAGLAVAGAVLAASGAWGLGLGSWVLLAAPFVAGLYGFEAFDRRWWRRAAL